MPTIATDLGRIRRSTAAAPPTLAAARAVATDISYSLFRLRKDDFSVGISTERAQTEQGLGASSIVARAPEFCRSRPVQVHSLEISNVGRKRHLRGRRKC